MKLAFFFFFKINKYIYIYIFFFIYLDVPGLSCSMWNLVPLPGIEPWPPALGTQRLGYWTIRDIPEAVILTGIDSQFTQK